MANLFDILYVNKMGEKIISNEIFDLSKGYIPIGLCIINSHFINENIYSHWMSLKYMNINNYKGSINSSYLYFGDITSNVYNSKLYLNGYHFGYLTLNENNPNNIIKYMNIPQISINNMLIKN